MSVAMLSYSYHCADFLISEKDSVLTRYVHVASNDAQFFFFLITNYSLIVF